MLNNVSYNVVEFAKSQVSVFSIVNSQQLEPLLTAILPLVTQTPNNLNLFPISLEGLRYQESTFQTFSLRVSWPNYETICILT